MHQNKLETFKDAGIATLFAILAIYFSGLSEPWLPILCGAASAVRLSKFDIGGRSFVFLVVIGTSFLENRTWFLGNSTIAFGISGFAATWIFHTIPRLSLMKATQRIVEILPALLVIIMMPLPASIGSAKNPKRGMIDAGVWAKTDQLPKGQEALSTKHQYGYEQFKTSQHAELVSPHQSLKGFDELILITPTIPFDDEFANAVSNWTSSGGRLLIVADHTNLFGHQTVLKKIVEEFGIALRPDALFETDTNGGIYGNLVEKFAGLTPCSISKGVIPRLKMAGWSERPDYTATSFFGKMDPTNDDQWGHHVVLGSKRYGLGEVSVFSDSTFFANFAINRWSSNVMESSMFWNRGSSLMAVMGLLGLLAYLKKPVSWLLFSGISLVILSPSIGFNTHGPGPHSTLVTLKPPDSVSNDSEERDKGVGSSLLASAYAFDLGIQWDQKAKLSFRDHIHTKGIALKASSNTEDPENWTRIPPFDIQEILNRRFYIDQNTFWYAQGAGLVRTANMANCWRSLGATIPDSIGKLTITNRDAKNLRGSDGKVYPTKVCSLPDNWVIFDDRIVGRWVPESSKWLVRKEWQLGPWLKGDLLFEQVP